MIKLNILSDSMGEKVLSNGVDTLLGEDKKILNSVAEHRELFTKYFCSAFGNK